MAKDGSGNVTLSEFYVYDGSNLLLVLEPENGTFLIIDGTGKRDIPNY